MNFLNWVFNSAGLPRIPCTPIVEEAVGPLTLEEREFNEAVIKAGLLSHREIKPVDPLLVARFVRKIND